MKGPEFLIELIGLFQKFPGVGQKTAERLAFHVLKSPSNEAILLAKALVAVKEKMALCSICNSITESNPCLICGDSNRDKQIVCVVEEPHDVHCIERAGEYNGVYHVLMGVLEPLDGVGPNELKIDQLVDRVKSDGIKEIILATNPNLEGEATAMYVFKVLQPLGVLVTRIARGLPMGGDLEYADEMTVSKALGGRMKM